MSISILWSLQICILSDTFCLKAFLAQAILAQDIWEGPGIEQLKPNIDIDRRQKVSDNIHFDSDPNIDSDSDYNIDPAIQQSRNSPGASRIQPRSGRVYTPKQASYHKRSSV